MFWASKRETSREEDLAYSLLGLFGITMPLLYGEGDKAFSRLQKAIIEVSDDETIFAWQSGKSSTRSGMFASHPSDFSDSGNIVPFHFFTRPSYSLTPKGLHMHVSM
jgi:hypothetical protein